MDNENQSTSSSSNDGGSKKWIMIAIAVIIIIAVVVGGGYFFTKNQSKTAVESANSDNSTNTEEAAQPTTEPEAMTSETPVATGGASASQFKDGTYSADGSYMTHAGSEKIGVTITIKDGTVTEVSVKQLAVRPMSKTMQADFAANYKTMVVGKNIDELKLGKVSGSSLTPMGFNAALEDIKSQAKS